MPLNATLTSHVQARPFRQLESTAIVGLEHVERAMCVGLLVSIPPIIVRLPSGAEGKHARRLSKHVSFGGAMFWWLKGG
jgi:hypothetical protein